MKLDSNPNISSDDSKPKLARTLTFKPDGCPYTIKVTGPDIWSEHVFKDQLADLNRQQMADLTEALLGCVINSTLYLGHCIHSSIHELDAAQAVINELRPMMIADKYAVRYHTGENKAG
jgi:hypothetical protein